MNEQLDRIELKLAEMEGKVDMAYQSSEKVRKYMLWTGIVTVGMIIIPLLIIPFALPAFFAAEGVSSGMSSDSLSNLGF